MIGRPVKLCQRLPGLTGLRLYRYTSHSTQHRSFRRRSSPGSAGTRSLNGSGAVFVTLCWCGWSVTGHGIDDRQSSTWRPAAAARTAVHWAPSSVPDQPAAAFSSTAVHVIVAVADPEWAQRASAGRHGRRLAAASRRHGNAVSAAGRLVRRRWNGAGRRRGRRRDSREPRRAVPPGSRRPDTGSSDPVHAPALRATASQRPGLISSPAISVGTHAVLASAKRYQTKKVSWPTEQNSVN